MIAEPYNQYEAFTDVAYSLLGYSVRHPEDESYPAFRVIQTERSMHHTFEEAKSRIAEIVSIAKENQNFMKWHSFYITEVPFGVCCDDGYDGQRKWSFTGKGEFVAYKYVSSLDDINGNCEIFWGRDEEDCRFQVGDVVELHCGKTVELGMICGMPIDHEFAKSRLPLEKPDSPLPYHLDYSDDNYQVISILDTYVNHAEVIDCFPAETLPLDESLVEKLKKNLEEYNKKNQ